MKTMKKAGTIVLAAMMVFGICPGSIKADEKLKVQEFEATTVGTESEISVKEVEFDFEEEENLSIDFITKVSYKNTSVTVKDETGTNYTAKISEKDWDDMDLKVQNLSKNHTYTISINGIKPRKASAYGTLTIKVQIKENINDDESLTVQDLEVTTTKTKNEISIKEIEFDIEDSYDNLSIDFDTKVKYKKGVSVTVKDETGTNYSAKIVEKDQDDMDIYIKNLSKNHRYTIVIDGIKQKNASAYGVLTIKASLKESVLEGTNTTAVQIKEAEYDREDKELDIKFKNKVVCSKDITVTLTNTSGKQIAADILEIDGDEIKVDTTGIKLPKTIEIKIEGIRTTKETIFGDLTANIIPELD